MMRKSVIGLAAGLALAPWAMGQSEFVLTDPPMDFEVLDFQPFDGVGDSGPWSSFNTVGLGLYGDDREIAGYDISGLAIPQGEVVTEATYQVMVTSINVRSEVLGVEEGNTPDRLSVYGYVGDGVDSLDDFQAGRYLSSADTSNPFVGEVVSFDVTDFVKGLVGAKDQYVGLAIRGDEVGLMAIFENGEFPKLTVRTDAGGCYPDFTGDGALDLFDFLAYVNAFNSGQDAADCDHNGGLDLFDFLCFVNAFNAGC